MNIQNSEKFYAQAQNFMPGGVNSPVRACRAVGRAPLFIDHAKGSKIYDVDGNEYIDYICSWGPNILGHANERVINAVTETCQRGLTFGACHSGEIELAKLIKKHFPSMEMLRLVNSGTEAVMSAIRAARGYTKRDKIVKFEGCYHGHSDGLLVKSGSGLLTNSIPDSAGVPKGYTDNTLLAKYNNKESVEKLFEEHGDDIACVIVEPCAANMGVVPPQEGFLRFLRDITLKYNSLLIFDEVITGFRLSIGGAQKYYNVKPDLTTLGKIVGGGMPLAVYGGKKEVMQLLHAIHGKWCKTIVIVSHDMDEISENCTRAAVFADGKVVMEGKPHELFKKGATLVSLGLDVPVTAKICMLLKERGIEIDTDFSTEDFTAKVLALYRRSKEGIC